MPKVFKIDYCPAIDIDEFHGWWFCKRLDEARLNLALCPPGSHAFEERYGK